MVSEVCVPMGPALGATCQHVCTPPAPLRLASCAQSTVPAQTCSEAPEKPERTSVKSIRKFCSQSAKLTPSGLRPGERGLLVTSVAVQP